MKRIVLSMAMLALGAAHAVGAAPFVPRSGSEVVEVLPRRGDALQREMQRLRAQPNDLALATDLARRQIALARSESDPRYLGYAQAALAHWWNEAAPPLEVRLLRATLSQSTHHFGEAMADLDAVVAVDPDNAQAWLTRATVQTVQGDYAGATASCARLSSLAPGLASTACIAGVGSMNGSARASEALLALSLQRNRDAAPELQAWALTLLAEIAQRRGDAATAEARFRQALALTPRDGYLEGAFADFLLEQQRPGEVLVLLKERTRVDGLLLRRALALQMQKGEAAALAADVAELAARFDAAMRRGDNVHQREQARFELQLRHDPAAALALARKNWAVQKEAADLRLLLEASAQVRDAAAARPAIDWMRQHRSEDVAAARLLKQLGVGS